MKCLVLGGGGFLGSHLCDALLTEGHAVRIFDRPNLERYRAFSADEDIEWVEGDFANQEEIARVVPGCDIIYHLVSTTLPKSSNDNPVYDVETNVVSTLHLLDVSRKSGVTKIIFVSSGGTVYGVPNDVPIREDHSTNPICSYGISKLTIEKYLYLYYTLYGLDYCVLRLANPYGDRQRTLSAQGAVAVFLHKALKNESIEIWGDGSVVRDYIYVSDAARAMVKAFSYSGEQKILNIGSGQGQSLNDVLEAIGTILGRQVSRVYMEGRALDVPANVLDISLAKETLKWRPCLSFQQGLERTIHWMQNIEDLVSKG